MRKVTPRSGKRSCAESPGILQWAWGPDAAPSRMAAPAGDPAEVTRLKCWGLLLASQMPLFNCSTQQRSRSLLIPYVTTPFVFLFPLNSPSYKAQVFPRHKPRRKGPSKRRCLLLAPHSHQRTLVSPAPASLCSPAASSTRTFPGTFGRRPQTPAMSQRSLKPLLSHIYQHPPP